MIPLDPTGIAAVKAAMMTGFGGVPAAFALKWLDDRFGRHLGDKTHVAVSLLVIGAFCAVLLAVFTRVLFVTEVLKP